MQKTDHYKEINFHAGHRVTGGRVYAYFVSTMERLLMLDYYCSVFIVKNNLYSGRIISSIFLLPAL